MQSNNVIVSVVAPVFNGEKYICAFIDSIIDQDFENWELIIVDDASTDRTVELIRNYMKIEKRIKLIIRERSMVKGANTCRNLGIGEINGKYFLILDSDDIVERCCLKQRIKFMENRTDLDYAVFPGNSWYINKQGEMVKGEKIWGKRSKIPPIVSLLRADYNFGVWNVIYRTKSESYIHWDEKLKIYMDFDYLFRVFMANLNYDFDDEASPDYGYIQGRANAITSSFVSREKYDSTMYLFKKTLTTLRGLNLNYYIKEYFYFFLSFYIKVVHSENYEMYQSFYHYIKQEYPKMNLRLKILDLYCRSRLRNGKKINKTFDALIVFFFKPNTIIPKILSRIH